MTDDAKKMTDSPTLLDRLDAGILTRAELEAEMFSEIYAGLDPYCRIPDGYAHCLLELEEVNIQQLDDVALADMLRHPPSAIVNPAPVHIQATEFFRMLLSGDEMVCHESNPLKPSVGAYLYGPPGVGKTHLMAAYGIAVLALLDERLAWVKRAMGDVVDRAYDRYVTMEAKGKDAGDASVVNGDIERRQTRVDAFWSEVNKFQARVRENLYRPTDVLYLGFQELYEMCGFHRKRVEALAAIERARIVFIDDIHPHGDPEQIQIVLHLLERRYELGHGGTFLTTNLDTTSLGGGDEMLGSRLLSRCAETLVTFDFSGCADWRKQIKSKRISRVEEEVHRRAAQHPLMPAGGDGGDGPPS